MFKYYLITKVSLDPEHLHAPVVMVKHNKDCTIQQLLHSPQKCLNNSLKSEELL